MSKDILRRCIFRPYRKGYRPVFGLTLWAIPGRERLGYKLTMDKVELFTGEDFGPSRLHAIDSDESIAALMTFLTLRPGDTDRDYFTNYTPAQLDYCAQHAEALACYCDNRFGNY